MSDDTPKPFFDTPDWTFERIQKAHDLCEKIAKEELKLDLYPNQIEIITTEQMLDAYSSHGLPSMYQHWSFGKAFVRDEHSYRSGQSGLAYEIVINSVPTINYLMQDNNMLTQLLVIAHAAFGHNSFFNMNYLFKTWTDAHNILEYTKFAKEYIRKCEEKYGIKEVEECLDACHAWRFYGVDKYRRPGKLSSEIVEERKAARLEEERLEVNELWRTLPQPKSTTVGEDYDPHHKVWFKEPEENILYFMEKKSPNLETWQREIIRITRKLSQYFYPQFQTKVMNEGWACVAGDTLIDTSVGLLRADEIVQSEYDGLVDDGEQLQPIVNWMPVQIKPRIRIELANGFALHGGRDHKIKIDGQWVELQQLIKGQNLEIVRGRRRHDLVEVKTIGNQMLTANLAEFLGLVFGCKSNIQTWVNSSSNSQLVLTNVEPGVSSKIWNDISKYFPEASCIYSTQFDGTMNITINSSELHDVVPDVLSIIRISPHLVTSGFVRGVVSARMKVNDNSLTFVHEDQTLMNLIQHLLLKDGVILNVTTNSLCELVAKLEPYELMLFVRYVGVSDERTQLMLNTMVVDAPLEPTMSEIIDIIYDYGAVYDFSVANSNSYKASCFINHNCFVHYYIGQRLWDEGLIDDGQYLEYLDLHTAVVRQPRQSAGFNPYWLGFHMFMDIKRMCENPTDEDKEWFPDIVNRPWLEVVTDAMVNFRDESFIRQFLSPHLIREMRAFILVNKEGSRYDVLTEVSDDRGYRAIRNAIADRYMYDNMFANIQIVGADFEGDRTLYLKHTQNKGMNIASGATEALELLQHLWSGYPINLDSDSSVDEYPDEDDDRN